MIKAIWKDNRCAWMSFIGKCYKFLHRYDEAIKDLEIALKRNLLAIPLALDDGQFTNKKLNDSCLKC